MVFLNDFAAVGDAWEQLGLGGFSAALYPFSSLGRENAVPHGVPERDQDRVRRGISRSEANKPLHERKPFRDKRKTRDSGFESRAERGAEEGTRTPTPLRALDPESSASTNSATSA